MWSDFRYKFSKPLFYFQDLSFKTVFTIYTKFWILSSFLHLQIKFSRQFDKGLAVIQIFPDG